jgi:hypothetical protein
MVRFVTDANVAQHTTVDSRPPAGVSRLRPALLRG